jgi:protein-export membrane protein SecD
MTRLQWKWILVGAITLVAVMLVLPTVNWYRMPPADRAHLEANKERPGWLVNLGLDLLGGTHLVYELELSDVLKKEGGAGDAAATSDAVSRQIEVIRNRVDQFGVAEPLIARQGNRWIVVQLPGVKDPDQAKALIGQTAVLEFRMVDSSEAAGKALQKALEKPKPIENGKIDPEVAKLLPKGTTLLPGKESSYYVVQAVAPLTGAHLSNARVEVGGQYPAPEVAFTFDKEGAIIFEGLTRANVGRYMAIVLDGVVYSAPVIKGPIPGGSGVIEGNFDMRAARNLAIVLRAGALPVPMKVIEERTVGPSVGDDSIQAGIRASVIALGVVMLFMMAYYRFSGTLACVALLLNTLYLVASMAYLKATLTLPGIAGVILTIGMAVDANVLIFERIREELRLGKPIRVAVETGYDRAFTAIFDSHVTTLISAAFLFQFGTGSIKGFAVTLTIGIAMSLFTAIFVTRMIQETILNTFPVKELSI